MAIRQTKYVDITSGVGGKAAVSNREMIARVFTTNPLCGIGHVYEFDDADAVMSFFGSTSDEYKFAAKYFGFVSKSVSKAKKISFFRWSATAVNPYIKSIVAADTTLSNYTGSNCKLALKLGETTTVVDVSFAVTTVPTFSTESTYAVGDYVQRMVTDVVHYYKCIEAVETAGAWDDDNWSEVQESALPYPYGINSLDDVCAAVANAVSASYTGATCAISNSKVTLTLPATVTDEVYSCPAQAISGTQKDLASLLGLTDAVVSNVSNGETPAEAASRSDSISDNYGSFMFVGGTALTVAENKAVAEWNAAKNYKYLFCISILGYTKADGSLVNSSAINELVASGTGVGGIVGTCVWCYKSADDYISAFPAALFATTDYSRANTTKTFMYQQNATIQAAITNDANANALDKLFVNYMGVTQSAGGLIQFSQDGFNMDGVDTAVYCNEVWMKASFWTAIMNLFLAVEKVPANDVGAGQIKTVMMDTITTAIKNGTIQSHKDFTVTQKVYIGQVLDNTEAWKDVWSNGYVLQIVIENVNNKYVAKYILVYSKGDAIRKVEGSDILI